MFRLQAGRALTYKGWLGLSSITETTSFAFPTESSTVLDTLILVAQPSAINEQVLLINRPVPGSHNFIRYTTDGVTFRTDV